MWRQWLEQPWCRFRSEPEPTTLHFPSPARKAWSSNQRLDELDQWLARIREPGYQTALTRRVLQDWQQRVVTPDFYKMTAKTLVDNKLWKDAEVLLSRALELDSSDTNLQIQYIKTLVRLGRKRDALAAAIRADECLPGDAGIRGWLGILYRQTGQWQDAERCLGEAIAGGGGDPRYYYNLSMVYAHGNRLDEAIAAIREAVRLGGNNNEYRKHLDKLLARTNQVKNNHKSNRSGGVSKLFGWLKRS